MTENTSRRAGYASLLPIAALIGLGAALFDYFFPGNGIHGTGGALTVIASTAVLLILALVRWRASATSGFVHGLLLVLLIVDIAGTALAAWLLTAWWILGAMVLALIGWLVDIPRNASTRAIPAPMLLAALAVGVCGGALVPSLEARDGQAHPGAATIPASEEAAVRYHGWYTFNGDLMGR